VTTHKRILKISRIELKVCEVKRHFLLITLKRHKKYELFSLRFKNHIKSPIAYAIDTREIPPLRKRSKVRRQLSESEVP